LIPVTDVAIRLKKYGLRMDSGIKKKEKKN